MFYDPNIDLVIRNYFENKERFLGVGNYTEEGFEQMAKAAPSALAAFREALTVPGLRMVFGTDADLDAPALNDARALLPGGPMVHGTDAVAGAHGRNIEELLFRVHEGGQAPADALISATSLAAESLGLGDSLGRVAPGFIADLIAVSGNPAETIDSLTDVRFVMIGGRVVVDRRLR